MNNNLTFRENGQSNPDDVLKVTSLNYLREALAAQRYEDCAELIRDAKSFGAGQSEITAVLTEYTAALTKDRNNEAKLNPKNRPRF